MTGGYYVTTGFVNSDMFIVTNIRGQYWKNKHQFYVVLVDSAKDYNYAMLISVYWIP